MSEPKQSPDPPSVDREGFVFSRMSDALVERLARGRVYYGWYIVAVVVMVGLFVASWRRLRAREAALTDLLETFEEPTPVGPVGVPANDSRNDRDGPPS